MSTTLRKEYFGPYKLVRSLGSAHNASRFAVLCSRTDTNYMLYRFDRITNQTSKRTLFNALLKMSTLDHPHLLKINSVSYDDHGRLCVITPYTGNHDGLVLLNELLEIRDGKLGVIEAARALEHLLGAIRSAHQQGVQNGSIQPSDILVDRYGCLQIQFYGFQLLIKNHNQPIAAPEHTTTIADEIRSIAELTYTMMTGLSARDEQIAPSRVIKKIDRAWDLWFEIGLDPIDGFESVEHALNAMPTNPNSAQWLTEKTPRLPQVHIGSMLRRFRSSPRQVSRSTRNS